MNLIAPLRSLLLQHNHYQSSTNNNIKNVALETSSTAITADPPVLLEEFMQQPFDFIHELRKYGVAMIDIRGYNCYKDAISNTKNNNNNNNDEQYQIFRSDETCDAIANIPRTVFDTARCTLDQLHRQQQVQQKQTPHLEPNETFDVPSLSSSSPTTSTVTYLECPIIASNQSKKTKNNDTNPNSAAHVYGYHPSGGMISTRYNMYREGFVFSDRHVTFDVRQQQQHRQIEQQESSMQQSPTLIPSTNSTKTSFGTDCFQMFTLLHDIADIVLSNIGDHLQLPNKSEEYTHNNYIQEHYGPTRHHSQWHLKRYTYHPDPANHPKRVVEAPPNDSVVVLPSHTDPSLISIVILDRPHIQSGAMGLQYFQRRHNNPPTNTTKRTGHTQEHVTVSSSSRQGEWVEIPYSGHDVAIVFVGSILQYITNGYFTAVKHRVVHQDENGSNIDATEHSNTTEPALVQRQRMAATLFCRPNPSALLKMVPSPVFMDDGTVQSPPPIITFEEWMDKTAKNYQKAKLDK